MQCQTIAPSVGESRLMNPDPYVPQDEPQRHKEQPQMRIASAGVNSPLPPLTITRFDAKPFAVTLANLRRRALHAPGSEQQFLSRLFAGVPIAVAAIAHTDPNGHLSLAAFHRVGVPARRLSPDRPQAGQFSTFPGASPGELHRHQERQIFLLQELDHGQVEKFPIQQNTPDFQVDFADPPQQSPQHRDQRFVASHPGQGQRVRRPYSTIQAEA